MKRSTDFWYREFIDFPRLFWMIDGIHKYQLDCRAEGSDYHPFYTISILDKDRKYRVVGAIPVDAVEFDKTKKELVDASFLDGIDIDENKI